MWKIWRRGNSIWSSFPVRTRIKGVCNACTASIQNLLRYGTFKTRTRTESSSRTAQTLCMNVRKVVGTFPLVKSALLINMLRGINPERVANLEPSYPPIPIDRAPKRARCNSATCKNIKYSLASMYYLKGKKNLLKEADINRNATR